MNTQQELAMDVEELESMDAMYNWDHFAAGMGIGVGLVGVFLGAVALT